MSWLAPLIALTAMEIVLGIDNIVFIAILAARLPKEQQDKARIIGLAAALITRVLLLFSISWVLGMGEPIFTLTDLGVPETALMSFSEPSHGGGAHGHAAESEVDPEVEKAEKLLDAQITERNFEEINGISVRDLILLFGGLFLIWKSVSEIHHKIEGHSDDKSVKENVSFGSVIFQIALLDIVFSLDSVITAVGMAKEIWVMVVAVIIAVIVMMVFSGGITRFVDKNPTVKMLALSFLILIGVLLMAEAAGTPIPKGYVYFAMAFSLGVEFLNMRMRGKMLRPAAGTGEPKGVVRSEA